MLSIFIPPLDLILNYAVNVIDVITREDVVNRGAFYTVVFNDNVVISVVFENGHFGKFAIETVDMSCYFYVHNRTS